MDEDLKRLYAAELAHLRSHSQEFARTGRFQRIAARLGLDAPEEARDPFVEWLLQGYAFLAARVQRRLEAESPRFTQALLSVVYPHLTAPTPSMIVAGVNMRPDPALLEEGALLPRGASFELARAGGGGAGDRPIRFTTARALRLFPVAVEALRYLEGPAAVRAAGASAPAPAAIAFDLVATPEAGALSALAADHLDLFVGDRDGAGPDLFEVTTACATRVEMAKAGAAGPALSLAPIGLDRTTPCPLLPGEETQPDETDALLPYGHRSFDGWRLLHEFLAFPDRFRFLRLGGLRRALHGREGRRATVLVLLNRTAPELAQTLPEDAIRTNCVPAVNLFPLSANDVPLAPQRTEHPILPDRRATDYEVHTVLSVVGTGPGGEAVPFRPFYSIEGLGDRLDGPRRYWHVVRRARQRPDQRADRDRSLDLYAGTEAFLGIVDHRGAPAAGPAGPIRSVGLDLLCSNRHRAEHVLVDLGDDSRLESDLALGWSHVEVAAGPSAPRAGLPEGRRLWDAVSHLSLNHLSLIDGERGERGDAAAALRALLRIYAPQSSERAQTLIDALADVSAAPTVRRARPLYDRPGDAAAPIAFVRGLEATLVFRDDAEEACGLAMVLARVLAGQADANSFVETVLRRPDGRERARFAPEPGTRPAP
jgi:type VI secretion system protein ImpG